MSGREERFRLVWWNRPVEHGCSGKWMVVAGHREGVLPLNVLRISLPSAVPLRVRLSKGRVLLLNCHPGTLPVTARPLRGGYSGARILPVRRGPACLSGLWPAMRSGLVFTA